MVWPKGVKELQQKLLRGAIVPRGVLAHDLARAQTIRLLLAQVLVKLAKALNLLPDLLVVPKLTNRCGNLRAGSNQSELGR